MLRKPPFYWLWNVFNYIYAELKWQSRSKTKVPNGPLNTKASIHCQSPLMKCQRAACIPDCVDWICCLMPLCTLWEKIADCEGKFLLGYVDNRTHFSLQKHISLLLHGQCIELTHCDSAFFFWSQNFFFFFFFLASVSFCCLIQKRMSLFSLFWCRECQVVWKSKVWHTYRNMHVLKASVATVPFFSSP